MYNLQLSLNRGNCFEIRKFTTDSYCKRIINKYSIISICNLVTEIERSKDWAYMHSKGYIFCFEEASNRGRIERMTYFWLKWRWNSNKIFSWIRKAHSWRTFHSELWHVSSNISIVNHTLTYNWLIEVHDTES